MKLNSIQFLRAIAALLVVYEHSILAQSNFTESWQQNFYNLNHFGCIGVDLFFVISGFIINYVANKNLGFKETIKFLTKRFYRINPVYYVATLLLFSTYWLFLQLINVPYNVSLQKTINSAIDSLLLIPTSINIESFTPLLNVGWTLAFEWLFYIIFSVLILFKVQQKAFFLPCLMLVLIFSGLLLKPNDLRLIFLTNPIMLDFALGVIICQIYLKQSKVSAKIAITCLVVGLCSYALLIRFGFGNVWHYAGVIDGKSSLSRFLFWGIPSSCIVAGCVFLEQNAQLSRLFNNKLMLLLGNASYSIYLIHLTILFVLSTLCHKASISPPADLMIWLQLIASVTISLGFYKFIEKPLLLRINNNKISTTTTNTTSKGNSCYLKTDNQDRNEIHMVTKQDT
jgi:exopolysaccharide production protein ExoZ